MLLLAAAALKEAQAQVEAGKAASAAVGHSPCVLNP